MTEQRIAENLPGWIKEHLTRYIETDGADGHYWDASFGGGAGMVATLLLTTVGRKSGLPVTIPLIYGRADGGYWDLGYTRTVERPDGKLVTVYYFNDGKESLRYIAATIWDPSTP